MKFRSRLRHWLLVAAFACGQLFMLAHAVEHDSAEAGEPAHACLLCVAGHDLGSPAPAVAHVGWPLLPASADALSARLSQPRYAVPSPALARGPPFA